MKVFSLFFLLSIIISKSTITTIAGGSKGKYSNSNDKTGSHTLSHPNQISIDAADNIFIAESGNHVVTKMDRNGNFSVVAGSYQGGYSGDGGIAVNAKLYEPTDVAFDGVGNIFIADGGNNCVRKVNQMGVIFTIAGTGKRGFSGDGGPAARATLDFPIALCFDRSGNLLVVERSGHRARKINTLGVITTLAGTGTPGFSGDGGPANRAQINDPTDIAVDAKNNVYIADNANHRIRKIDPSGKISTFAGTGFAGYSEDGSKARECRMYYPYGIFVDAKDNVYYTDNENALVRKIDKESTVTTLAGTPGKSGYSGDGGLAIKARIFNPGGLAINSTRDLFVADYGNNALRKITFIK